MSISNLPEQDRTLSAMSNLIDNASDHISYATPNPPNAAVVMRAMRHVGYDNHSAVKDIIDNSIDSGATRIVIKLELPQNPTDMLARLSVSDNGDAMNLSVLNEALKLGSMTTHNPRSDLGKFGMGLVTAGHSIAKRISVTTKQVGAPLFKSISDLDVVSETGAFVKALYKGSAADYEDFKNEFAESGFEIPSDDELHGTIVSLEHCDGWIGTRKNVKRLTRERVASHATALAHDLGATYRQYIDAGLKLFVNDIPVISVDPFNKADGGKILLDEPLEFDVIVDGAVTKETVRVRVGTIPEGSESTVFDRQRPNLRSQGFSILRNHREISHGETLDLFTRHNMYNRLRAEIEVPAALDEMLGVSFTKQGIRPNQAFLDKLRELTFGTIRQIGREDKKTTTPQSEDQIKMHREAEKDIAEKQHLLLLPPGATIGTRSRGTSPKDKPGPTGETTRISAKRVPSKTQPRAFRSARFETADLGEFGPIYQADKEGTVVVITWNTMHPFYEAFVLGNNPRGAKAIDYFVYSLACTELYAAQDEDTADFMDEMKALVASNMRTLLR